MTNGLLKPSKSKFIIFLGPGLIWYIFIVLFPIFNAVKFSFYRWSGGDTMKFIGLKNYITLFTDKLFWKSFLNNLTITGLCLVGQIGIALIVASILISKYAKFKSFHRAVLFFPVVLAPVVIGFIWGIIYNKDYGILNWLLRTLKLDFLIFPYLDDPKKVIYSVSIPLIWQYIGYYMVILMSGISNISSEIFEMSEIDGATGWKKLIYIIFPLIKETIIVCTMLCIAGNMKVFAHILVMTGGGPGTSSMVMTMYAYNRSYLMHKYGFGSAASIGILILSLAVVILTRIIMRRGKSAN